MLRLVQYSEKSFAIFGDSKPIKDTLKLIGGKFNACLKDKNEQGETITTPGWIFSAKLKPELEKIINTVNTSSDINSLEKQVKTLDLNQSKVSKEANEKEEKEEKKEYISKALESQEVIYENKEKKITIINYSDKSICIYGEGTKENKEKLKELSARFNASLTIKGSKAPGFICSNKNNTHSVLLFTLKKSKNN